MNKDIDNLENALIEFHRMMSRSKRWDRISADAGVLLDRTSAIILGTIFRQGSDYRMQDIVDKIGLEPAVVTRKIQHLEQLGLVERQLASSDKRAFQLQVTSAGELAAQKLRSAQRQLLSETIEDWDEQERQTFIELLRKFTKSASTTTNTSQK
jgi:DNA-binding MarR family transcriptional regulator